MPLVLSMALWAYKETGMSVSWVVRSPCLLYGSSKIDVGEITVVEIANFKPKFRVVVFQKLLSIIFKINHAS